MKKNDQKARIVSYIVFTFTTIICVFPFLLLLSASLSDDNAVVQYGYRIIPNVFSLDAYQYILSSREYIFHAYGITILVTAVGTAASLIMTSMLSYPLSNPYLPGRKIFLFIVLFTMLFNGGLVPSYLVYTQLLHIKNTLWALLIPSLLLNGFNVMIMRTFFQNSIPRSLIESAKIDGATEWKIYWMLILPLSKPVMATIGLMTGLAYWNDWANGLYYITESNKMSLQNVLNSMLQNSQFLSQHANLAVKNVHLPTTTIRMAIAVIGIVPVMIIYPFLQKYFAKGLTVGAVKG